jgi:hypothetical protein
MTFFDKAGNRSFNSFDGIPCGLPSNPFEGYHQGLPSKN